MTLEEFKNTWWSKPCDFDGSYGNQCVDLYRYYVKQVLDCPQSPGVGGAAEIWDSADPKYYDFITNDPNNTNQFPISGDIVIWNRRMGGGFGHVAIVLSATGTELTVLETDGTTGSGLVQIKNRSYTNVIGWLHPKGNMSTVQLDNATFERLVSNSSRYDEFCKIGYTSAAQVEKEINDLKQAIGDKNTAIDVQEVRAEEARKALNDLVTACAKALNTVQEVTQVKAALVKATTDLDTLDNLQRQYAELQLHSSETQEELNAEIARWKAIAEQKANLGDYETSALIKEVVKRLLKVVDLAK